MRDVIKKPDQAVRELPEKRTPNGKHFLMPDGSVTAIFSRSLAHYLDEKTGLYEEVDSRFFVDQETTIISVLSAEYKCVVHATGVGFEYVSRNGGSINATLVSVGETRIDKRASYSPVINDDRLVYSGVVAEFDVCLLALGRGMRALHYLHGKEAPKEFVWEFECDEKGLGHLDDSVVGSDASNRECQVETVISDPVVRSGLTKKTMHAIWSGNVVVVDPRTRVKSLSSEAFFPVVLDPTFGPITDNADDGTEYNNLVWETGLNYGAPNVIDKSGFDNYARSYRGCWRFQNVTIPQGSTITSATIDLYFQKRGMTATLRGYATDNAAAWTPYTVRPGVIAATSASGTMSAATNGAHSLNVASIVQEIVNRAGWVSGNALSIFAKEMTFGGYGNFNFTTDYGSGASVGTEASLTVTYTAGSSGAELKKNPVPQSMQTLLTR